MDHAGNLGFVLCFYRQAVPAVTQDVYKRQGQHVYSDVKFEPDCYIMFGKESAGIPEEILLEHPNEAIRIPMMGETRSLNLANSVSIVLYEALRQNGFAQMKMEEMCIRDRLVGAHIMAN